SSTTPSASPACAKPPAAWAGPMPPPPSPPTPSHFLIPRSSHLGRLDSVARICQTFFFARLSSPEPNGVRFLRKFLPFSYAFVIAAIGPFVLTSRNLTAQVHDHTDHQGMQMAPETTDPTVVAKLRAKHLADKKESEFNHHLAGAFVVAAALLIFCEAVFRPRFPFLRYVWPLCFLGAGIFLLVFSDTELWPWGPRSWWWGLTQNREDLQHKTFAVILLGLAYVEIQRA